MGMVNGARRNGRIDIGSAGVDQTSPSFVKPFYDVWSETVNTFNSTVMPLWLRRL